MVARTRPSSPRIAKGDRFQYAYDGLDRLVDYRRGKEVSGFVPKSPTDATNLLYRQSWATLDGSGNVSGVKLASHGNWMQWTVDSNGGTAGGSSTQSRQVNLVNEIDTDNIDGDADDPITGSSWIDPVYDKNGNMTKAPKGQGSETTAVYFVYDGWGRAAGISSTASHDGDFTDTGEVQYEYDGADRRISKTFAGTSIADEDTFWNEDFQALETRRNGSANAYEQTVYDLRYIDAPVLRYRDANGHTTSTSTGDGTLEEVLYVTYDANFNVTGLVQENQSFVERYVNTPFGDRLVLTGTFGARSATSYDLWLGHQGLRIDAESGTYYNKGRQELHPGLGLFTQRDPLLTRYQDGMSLYQPYAGNPVNGTDPYGLARTNCDQLLKEIEELLRKLIHKIQKYDSIADGQGGAPFDSGKKMTQPGSHFKSILDMQGKLRRIIQEYDKNCPCPDDPDKDSKRIPKRARDYIYKKLPPPIFQDAPWWAGGGREMTDAIDTTSDVLFVAGAVTLAVGTAGGGLTIIGGGAAAGGGGAAVAGSIGPATTVGRAAAAAAPLILSNDARE